VAVALAAAVAWATREASAQLRVGVAGGPATPLGDFGDPLERGFHGGVVLDAGVPLFPVGVRADLTYLRLPAGDASGQDYSQVAGTLNARVDLLPIPLLDAYAIGGVGLYASDYADAVPGASGGWATEPGINLGVGASVNLIFIRPFAEVRYHRVMKDPARSFVPLTVGVMLF
jgi:hypothetical protein